MRAGIESAVRLRRRLHRDPELAGAESGTARIILEHFAPLQPDETLEDLGGHGLAFVFRGAGPGPTVLLRCELDAVPVRGSCTAPHRSRTPGVSHQCGHDGHMAILAAVGEELAAVRPARGRVVLLYQPAEENGAGAAAVIADPRFERIRPDWAFALHNLPGFPLGEIVLRAGVFTSASRGASIRLTGRSAHAAQPETGCSPAGAMARLVARLAELSGPGGADSFVTVVGAQLGEKAFGTAPDRAEVWATLRSAADGDMAHLVAAVEQAARKEAVMDGLDCGIDAEDEFPATVNSGRAVDIVRGAAGDLAVRELEAPFRWSEDFGRFTALAEGCLFGLGAGADCAELHDPEYDFPDELIGPAAGLLLRILDRVPAP